MGEKVPTEKYTRNSFIVVVTFVMLINHGTIVMGQVQVSMLGDVAVSHSIGANITIVSQISNGCDVLDILLYITEKGNYNPQSKDEVAYIYCQSWEEDKDDVKIHSNTYEFLNLSYKYGMDHSRLVQWNFFETPKNYDGLNLTTRVSSSNIRCGSQVKNEVLSVRPCKSSQTKTTVNQTSSFNITTESEGHFNAMGSCNCLGTDEVLFNVDGTIAEGTVTCGQNAEWIGCEDVQCWSGPRNITANQCNTTASAFRPFECVFTEGFPNATGRVYKIDGKEIPYDYYLKSQNHDQMLSCKVVSEFTDKMNSKSESVMTRIVVHFSPENSYVSDDSFVVKVNDSKLLKYFVSANPIDEKVELSINKVTEGTSANITKIREFKNNTRYTYELNITVGSDDDYGHYRLCALTNKPGGTDCDDFMIRNDASATTSQLDTTTTFSVATETKPIHQGISAAIIGAIAASAILLVVIVAGAFILYKRRKASNIDNSKESKDNELYSTAQFQMPPVGNPESVKQEKTNILYGSASSGVTGDVVEYATTNSDAGTVLSAPTTEEPCCSSTAVYAQINKKKGNVNDGYNVEIHDDGGDTSAVVDKSKKQGKDDVPEVYAVVNKPRKIN